MKKRMALVCIALMMLFTMFPKMEMKINAEPVGAMKEYEDTKLLTGIKVYDENKKIKEEHFYEYDNNNVLRNIKKKFYGEYGYSSETTFSYDRQGNLISSVILNGETKQKLSGTEYTYDSKGRLVKLCSQEDSGYEEQFEYDSDGNCIKMKSTGEGSSSETSYSYADGKLTKAVQKTIEEWSGTGYTTEIEYVYDNKGQLIEEIYSGENIDKKIYTYDYKPFIISEYSNYRFKYLTLKDRAGNELDTLWLYTCRFFNDEDGYIAKIVDVSGIEKTIYEFYYDEKIAVPEYSSADDATRNNWPGIYYDFIVQDRKNMDQEPDWDEVSYELIYLDEDDIPEIWVDYGISATGCAIFSINKGEVSKNTLSSGGLLYDEGKNIFIHSWGKMDYYFDTVYKIENGSLTTVVDGRYEVKNSSDGETWTYYYIDDTEVTEAEYKEKLKSYVSKDSKETLYGEVSTYDYSQALNYFSKKEKELSQKKTELLQNSNESVTHSDVQALNKTENRSNTLNNSSLVWIIGAVVVAGGVVTVIVIILVKRKGRMPKN